jgi:AraC family transcriptional regulator of adaptative response / DNA-3-methyladenine glycosylase II
MPKPAPPGAWRLRLRLPIPWDLHWMLAFLAGRAVPSLERVAAGEVLRVVRMDGGAPVLLRVRPAPAAGPPAWLAVLATPLVAANPGVAPPPAGAAGPSPSGPARTPAHDRAALRRLLRRMFDLDTDLGPFLALARRDPVLAPLAARNPGLRLPQLPDPLEGAVRAIVGQQVSVAGARTVVDRLVRRFGDPVAAPGLDGLFAFPRPAILAAAQPEQLTALGLTRAKAAALRAVAAATHDGAIDWEGLRTLPAEDAQAALQALPGIGPWTAAYIRMRALADPDAFPASDLGLLKALAAHDSRAMRESRDADVARDARSAGDARNAQGKAASSVRATAAATTILADGWRPFRAYAAIHLWHSLSA